ncbi:NAD(P)H-dependent oxidoreductase [Aliivibrio fischeri]|uniref:NAD(P)H-dependent oxidoreductase n=1 Tax=Aliivibrio fischeri TaxID=668 RepID=UPI00080DBC78|nr:NAD(P)H-dependent oxidoreductase [Aliivibrio fischeri]MUK27995.1 flavodoxin family protein [Aliivibrio fischeri]MUK34961.1 flavodoxin family protein [Aliivibrio fischeri]OCH49079.1 potassium transporter KefG [Aliivibrio fischeri]OED58205.1 potassium transporter KefG [Aliivibrio fischeri]
MINPAKKVLILFAHPSQHRSEVNVALIEQAKKIENVTVVDLYHDYPKFNIDIDKEQKQLLEHDVVIFQFPLYWYSTPAILKEWQDMVLEYGFAYGTDGNALKGKTFLCAITAGGKEEAYQTNGYNQFTIRELLHPLEQMASLTHMEYIAPLVLFGARTALEDDRIERHTERFKVLLSALVEDLVDTEIAKTLPKLNHSFDKFIKE